MSSRAVQPSFQPLRARVAHLTGLLNCWLGIDDWSDDLIAPADLVRETQAAVEGGVGLRALVTPSICGNWEAQVIQRAAVLGAPAAPADGLKLASKFESCCDGLIVVDHVNGLQWQAQDDGVRRTWAEAKAYCEQLRLGGEGGGWRLPTVAELNSLVDRSRRSPAINTDLFPGTKSNWYWTGEALASSDASSPSDYAWYVYFDLGGVYCNYQDYSGFVRAVRRVPAGQ